MTKDEALKLALDALETSMYPQQKQLQAITAIKEALAQPETDWERVARIKEEMLRVSFEDNKRLKEALAQQDSKDKEQAKTDSFVRQLDEALAQQEPWEKFCDSNCVWTDHHPDCKLAEPEQKLITVVDIEKIVKFKERNA